MKIALGGGTPIFLSRRKLGGAEVIQGTSRVKLSEPEIAALARALNAMSASDAQGGKEKMTEIERT